MSSPDAPAPSRECGREVPGSTVGPDVPRAGRDFDGRRVLVTGAGLGIGRATAQLLARRGAYVCAVDVSPEVMSLAAAPTAGRPKGSWIEPRQVDLGDAAAVERLTSEIAGRGSADILDTLVNCAAAYPPGGLLDSTDADWLRVLRVNVLAAASLSRAMARRLVDVGGSRPDRPGADARRTGVIVNVGSVQESLPLPGHAAYVTSKGALTALTNALAVELADHDIRVNAVAPGVVDSPSMRTKLGATRWDDGGPPAPTLLGRSGTVDEVAEAIAFLASDSASFVTGAVLAVDGGRRLSRRRDRQLEASSASAVAPAAPDEPHLSTGTPL